MKDLDIKEIIDSDFFQFTLLSHIVITTIVFYGFYLIFNNFNKKQKAFKQKQNGK